ncbi:LacI family DNA-binding transcriptional regulator [Jiangella mangrovi]|uniref:DNA-binding LacI/PurR family transcriptional regulator n=1 Tax=Jiangella mangrovi TaxID=1524084 RepID=A0A7W9LPS0_9ACTN|nr:LacI family DNA-binding transcriptional regulator [Jiangella mangrovi]MBB5791695.1 DNA-binding LacI/PurR family transcriptional regulator [Jiangella mangrovi]
MVTLSDIAREAGVSVSVASRVLNRDATLRIRETTRERVVEVARRLDYAPNHRARSLRLARTGAIAFVVPEVNNAIFAEVVRGVEDGADELGLDVLMGSGTRLDPGTGFLERLDSQRRVDGFLIQPLDTAGPGDVFAGRNAPEVWLNTFRPDGSVYLDNAAGARVAVEHLLALGHTRIGLVGGRDGSYTARERRAGYIETLKEAGQVPRPEWATAYGYSAAEGRRAGLDLLGDDGGSPGPGGERPTALLVANVNAAIGVLGAARELDVAVPGDVSVVALHDVWFAEYSEPGLTVVRLPLYEMGYHGIHDLHRRVSGEPAGARRIVDPAPRLVVRGSTAPAA